MVVPSSATWRVTSVMSRGKNAAAASLRLAAGKSVMANWVTLDELKPLLDNVGNQGLNIQMDFKSEKEIDEALKIIDSF